MAPPKCCLFCDHCTDVFWDFEGPYMFLCDVNADTSRGIAGMCERFREEDAMRIESNPNGCVDESKRGDRTCMECYWSQINEHKQWTGDERCWNAQCIVAREDRCESEEEQK